MKVMKSFWRKLARLGLVKDERGSALVIVTLILALLTVYISASLMTATTDAISSNFAVAQQRAFYTAYSKIEQMTGDFSNLFLTSLSPSYDSMCRVVIGNPTALNGFDLAIPSVNCPSSAACVPNYSGKFLTGTNLYDLGWEGDPIPNNGYCIVDVCNPNAAPACNFPIRPTNAVQIQKGDFTGLQGFARRFRMVSTATNAALGGADTQITRDFNNYLLPVFQFGIFTDTDFELLEPPPWTFGGWVHTNGDFYATGDTSNNIVRNVFSQYGFDANGRFVRRPGRITVAKHMVIGSDKTGKSTDSFIRVYKTDTTFDDIYDGTAVNGPNVNNCNQISNPSIDAPPGNCNSSFSGTSSGTVKTGVRPLKLPIQNLLGANPIEIIKRGLPSDLNPAVSSPFLSARFYYKPGIRITLADYQSQLPRQVLSGDPPTEGSGPFGGIQLDGPDPLLGATVGATGNAVTGSTNNNWYYLQEGTPSKKWPIPRGYQPKVKSPSSGTARPSGARVNGYRVHGWIKVELVRADGRTFDITEEFLNLGITVPYQANTGSTFYYPRNNPNFPGTLPLAQTSNGPYPDENSIIHLQRMGVAYTDQTVGGSGSPSMPSSILNPALDAIDGAVRFDYYASMALRRYNNSSLEMYGIRDEADNYVKTGNPGATNRLDFTTRFKGGSSGNPGTLSTADYAEPQPDPGGYYTDAARVSLPTASPVKTEIDFTGGGSQNRGSNEATNIYNEALAANGGYPLSENVNLPKQKGQSVLQPETTWAVNDSGGNPFHLVPFPINMYDTREGMPHEPRSGQDIDPPLPGIIESSPNKNGTMNLIEIDMGNLGRLLRGNFDGLFAQMGSTPYSSLVGTSLRGADLRDNIDINQDSGWIVYISDRRGDEPTVSGNVNLKTPLSQYPATPSLTNPPNNAKMRNSVIGDGEYNREDVVWNPGGRTTTGSAGAVPVKSGAPFGCGATPDNQDFGKSPQDSNNDCFIQSEDSTGQYSETAAYSDIFDEEQYITDFPNLTFSPTLTNPSSRRGVGLAITQTPTVRRQTWSNKPPAAYRDNQNDQRVEIFRRAVRLVNAANLFPTGPEASACGGLLGVTISSENPVYIFGNYNAPAGENIDATDPYPGINGNPPSITTAGVPTSLGDYSGQNFANCGNNCHVPTSIIADAVTLLSGSCVGNTNTNWSGANGAAGWLDSRSFMSPYQAIAYRPARNTVFRVAIITGYTPSWYSNYWGSANINQGPTTSGNINGSDYSSGGLNNFPRFLEDWGQNGQGQRFAIYGGSLIRIYKSRQGNGAFKRISSNSSLTNGSGVDYVYVPPNRDWVFDLDFSRPCTLPPGTPFLQLIDFKGFQESVQQQR